MERFDPSHKDFADAGGNLLEQAEDLSREIRNYAEQIEFNPRRLVEIEERIGLLNNLKRKYGGSMESILEFREATKAKLEKINYSGERIAELENIEKKLLEDLSSFAQVLSGIRKAAAEKLSHVYRI